MKNKPRVSTKTKEIIIRENKIVNLLKESPEGLYPKIIAYHLRENQNTIKSHLRKMESKGIIKRDLQKRGIYNLVENKVDDVLSDFKFQNAMLTCKIPKIKEDFIVKNNLNDLVRYRISFCQNTSKATLRLKSPNGINVEAILIFVRLFILEIEKNCNYEPTLEEIQFSSIEFNKDYSTLRLEGAQCLTLSDFIAQYKIYQKAHCVREEYKTKLPIPAKALFELLNSSNNYASLSLEVSYLRILLNDVKKLLSKILNYLKK